MLEWLFPNKQRLYRLCASTYYRQVGELSPEESYPVFALQVPEVGIIQLSRYNHQPDFKIRGAFGRDSVCCINRQGWRKRMFTNAPGVPSRRRRLVQSELRSLAKMLESTSGATLVPTS